MQVRITVACKTVEAAFQPLRLLSRCRHEMRSSISLCIILIGLCAAQNLDQRLNKALAHLGDSYSWSIQWTDLLDGGHATAVKQPFYALHASNEYITQLMDCINHHGHAAPALTWSSALAGEVDTLSAVAGVWSKAPVKLSATVTTFAGMNRLHQVATACSSWPGPLSLVLYKPLLQQPGSTILTELSRWLLKRALIKVLQLATQMASRAGTCQLSILLTYEIVHDEPSTLLIPLNMLRNYARLQARTPLVAMLDVDLIPSASLFQRIALHSQELLRQAASRTVLIIPTLEMAGGYRHPTWAESFASLTHKTFLMVAFDNGVVEPFFNAWPTGHRLTNWTHWRTATTDYDVAYDFRCEPYLLAARHGLPWFDSRYRGWGEDKLQHALALNYTGFRFRVMSDAFTVHRPHSLSPSRDLYWGDENAGDVTRWRTHVERLFKQQLAAHLAGQPYKPVLPKAILTGLQRLPWWNESAGTQGVCGGPCPRL